MPLKIRVGFEKFWNKNLGTTNRVVGQVFNQRLPISLSQMSHAQSVKICHYISLKCKKILVNFKAIEILNVYISSIILRKMQYIKKNLWQTNILLQECT